jgi:hypothetical protein
MYYRTGKFQTISIFASEFVRQTQRRVFLWEHHMWFLCTAVGMDLAFILILLDWFHYSLGYLQFHDADVGSSKSATSCNIRRLNPIPGTLPSQSLHTSSSLIDVRGWETLFSGSDSEGSAGALVTRGRDLSAQPFKIPSFLTPDQMRNAASKFRLPSIDGGYKRFLNKGHRFRASASLDNRKSLVEKYRLHSRCLHMKNSNAECLNFKSKFHNN